MALKETIRRMHNLIEGLAKDLYKAEKGNKAAAQRVRTATIKFSKISKTYRKESVKSEKGSKKRKTTTKKKTAAKRKSPAKKKATRKKKTTSRRSTRR